jgi:hypothetical protein
MENEFDNDKCPIVVDTATVFTLDSDDTLLYIPLNSIMQIVHPKKAIKLECWRYVEDGAKQHLPVIFDRENAGGLTLALVKSNSTKRFGSFYRSSLEVPGERIRNWALRMHRAPELDIARFVFTVKDLPSEVI